MPPGRPVLESLTQRRCSPGYAVEGQRSSLCASTEPCTGSSLLHSTDRRKQVEACCWWYCCFSPGYAVEDLVVALQPMRVHRAVHRF